MVTDSQYKELKEQVKELERRIDNLSLQLSRLILKNDVSKVQTNRKELSKKDTTKYLFDNKILCKRRIAYECVKKYVVDNNIVSYSELLRVFPDYLQGSLGVVKPIEIAERYSNAHRRYYFGDEDILQFEGKKYVVCSQWEKKNINRILKVASTLGYQIQSVSVD